MHRAPPARPDARKLEVPGRKRLRSTSKADYRDPA
jgi:hypothetical protein